MGYLLLTIALLAGAAKGFCGKKTSSYLSGLKGSMLVNIIRMSLCIVIGFCIVLFDGGLKQLLPSAQLLLIAALSGIFTAVFVVTWLVAIRKSAYMMTDIFLMLGVLLPIIAGSIFFDERVKLTQWIGFIMLFAAVVIMCSYNNTIKTKLTFSMLLVLLLSGTANGAVDFSQKLFVKSLPEIPVSVFNFYTYIFAGISLVIAYCFVKPQEDPVNKEALGKIFGYVLAMAVCLFANSYFQTLAANYLDSVLLYPLSRGSALILSTLMSAAFFKERITTKCILGVVTAFCSLLIINLL